MEVPVLVRLVGLNAAVAPVGRPVTPNVVAVAYPPIIVSVTVDVALPPGGPESIVGDAETLKPCADTISVTLAVRFRLPLIAVIVMG
jgi:hypothetical protein